MKPIFSSTIPPPMPAEVLYTFFSSCNLSPTAHQLADTSPHSPYVSVSRTKKLRLESPEQTYMEVTLPE